MPKPITQKRLKEVLWYNPYTGLFFWQLQKGNNVKAGNIAGTIHSKGYREIGIDGSYYKAHRLSFLYMTGKFPDCCVDHINGFKSDNRWDNLREANKSQNAANSRSHKGKLKGVVKTTSSGRYAARIGVGNKLIHLGCFDTPEEAHQVYLQAARKYFGEFANAG